MIPVAAEPGQRSYAYNLVLGSSIIFFGGVSHSIGDGSVNVDKHFDVYFMVYAVERNSVPGTEFQKIPALDLS